MAASPVVDGIERQYPGQLNVIRLNVQDPVNRPWLARLGFQATPTFILLDASGHELWRSVGTIEPARVSASLAAP